MSRRSWILILACSLVLLCGSAAAACAPVTAWWDGYYIVPEVAYAFGSLEAYGQLQLNGYSSEGTTLYPTVGLRYLFGSGALKPYVFGSVCRSIYIPSRVDPCIYTDYYAGGGIQYRLTGSFSLVAQVGYYYWTHTHSYGLYESGWDTKGNIGLRVDLP